MSLPTRIQRYADPFESAQREFDNVLGRLIGNRVVDGGDYPAPTALMSAKTATICTSRLNCPATRKKRSTSTSKTRR